MSANETVAEERCASCGSAGGEDVTLKNCNGCFLVKYCGVECQRNHRQQHKRACKRRAAELKDELLFKQPESSYLGDCPICLKPIPLYTSQDTARHTMYSCCSKLACNACVYANTMRAFAGGLPVACPLCQHSTPTEEECLLLAMKRVEANDPLALCNMGTHHSIEGDHTTAIKYWEKAAMLGHAEAHYHLSVEYEMGRGAEKEAIYHGEQAAIGGHPFARHNLGVAEEQSGNFDRAVKHWMIAANLGYDESMQALLKCYQGGMVSKEDYAATLRAYQDAVGATKSPERDAAEVAQKVMQRGV